MPPDQSLQHHLRGKPYAGRGHGQTTKPFNTQHAVIGLLLIALLFSILPTGLSWDPNKNPDMVEGSWVRRVQWISLYAVAFYFLLKIKINDWLMYFLINPFLFVLLLYTLSSALWSDFSGIVIRQGVQYIGVLMIAMVCAHWFVDRFDLLYTSVLYVLLLVCAASIILVVVNPTVALEVDAGIEGAWRGVMEHKNLLGIACGVGLLVWVAVASAGQHPIWFSVTGLLLILLCLVQTKSSTSLFFGVTSVALYLALFREHIKARSLIFRGVIASSGFLLLVVLTFFVINDRMPTAVDFLVPFSALFGKGADLTGRGDIWFFMRQSIESHPWLGTGYASFWLGVGGPSQYIADALRWSVPSAHNGYLDLMNELGLIGFSLFALQLIFHLKNIIKMFAIRRAEATFHFCLFYIFLISNSSESQALRVTSFLQFFVFISILMVHQFSYNHKFNSK